jgi:hypothetical protein
MGALRASELWRDGMIGVGRIFGWYKDGVIEDDAEVALLHAGPEHRFEPFTVPLVNVRHNAERAQKAKVLTAREARFLVAAAQCVFFKERTWERVLEETGSQWSQSTREKWRAFAKKGLEDLKAIDARACVRAAAEFARHPSAPAVGQRTHTPSSLVRRRRLRDGASAVNGRLVPNARILAALLDHPDVEAMANAGLRTLLLAGWARELGLSATHAECEAAQRTFWEERAVPAAQRAGLLASAGLDRAEAAVLFETLALEAKLLENAARMVNDGPGIDEALSFEARRLGLWSREARRLAHQRS